MALADPLGQIAAVGFFAGPDLGLVPFSTDHAAASGADEHKRVVCFTPPQHGRSRSRENISSSDGCVYTTVVSGDACLANRCARNRSLEARYTFVTAECRN